MCALFPEFRERFVQDLSLDFSCNLWQLHEDIEETYTDIPEPLLPDFQQRRNRRNRSTSASSSAASMLDKSQHIVEEDEKESDGDDENDDEEDDETKPLCILESSSTRTSSVHSCPPDYADKPDKDDIVTLSRRRHHSGNGKRVTWGDAHLVQRQGNDKDSLVNEGKCLLIHVICIYTYNLPS